MSLIIDKAGAESVALFQEDKEAALEEIRSNLDLFSPSNKEFISNLLSFYDTFEEFTARQYPWIAGAWLALNNRNEVEEDTEQASEKASDSSRRGEKNISHMYRDFITYMHVQTIGEEVKFEIPIGPYNSIKLLALRSNLPRPSTGTIWIYHTVYKNIPRFIVTIKPSGEVTRFKDWDKYPVIAEAVSTLISNPRIYKV